MDPNVILKTPMPRPHAVADQASQSEWLDGWFKVRKTNVDIAPLRQTCMGVKSVLASRYGDKKTDNGYENLTTNLFGNYNLFMFSSAPLHGVFREICSLWNAVKPDDDIYYLQSWLNVYDSSESIGWHYHWTEKYSAWHGLFGVDVDVSKTTYALQPRHYQMAKEHPYMYNNNPVLEFDEKYQLVNYINRDGFVMMSPSAGDCHRNIPWGISDRPRITIAFDIVPGRHIFNEDWENHWIPLA